ncbi:MAG: glycosyltransferase [Muribaculaceae bacterium]|nr:glycosyltransferase [Muribaculaceae bacterium]
MSERRAGEYSGERVSVVTVCRNALPMLKKTLESVGNQSLRSKIEYIVIDGKSTDGSPEFCREMQEKGEIDIFLSEEDSGIYDAMNKGTGLASGKWIMFMNAGDVFSSRDVVERLLDYADNFPESGVIYGDVRKQGADGEWEVKRAGAARNSHRMFFCHQSVMTLTKLQKEYGFDLSHPLSADFKFFKVLLKKGVEFRHIGLPVADFDTGGVSNRRRALGLADNIRVVMESDGFIDRLRFLPHLVPVWLMCKLRGKG